MKFTEVLYSSYVHGANYYFALWVYMNTAAIIVFFTYVSPFLDNSMAEGERAKKKLRLRTAPSCKRHLHLLIPVDLPGVLCVLPSHTHSAVTPNLSFNDAVKFF
jgi:hypothetical protein